MQDGGAHLLERQSFPLADTLTSPSPPTSIPEPLAPSFSPSQPYTSLMVYVGKSQPSSCAPSGSEALVSAFLFPTAPGLPHKGKASPQTQLFLPAHFHPLSRNCWVCTTLPVTQSGAREQRCHGGGGGGGWQCPMTLDLTCPLPGNSTGRGCQVFH